MLIVIKVSIPNQINCTLVAHKKYMLVLCHLGLLLNNNAEYKELFTNHHKLGFLHLTEKEVAVGKKPVLIRAL
jgi:hypothetical protein